MYKNHKELQRFLSCSAPKSTHRGACARCSGGVRKSQAVAHRRGVQLHGTMKERVPGLRRARVRGRLPAGIVLEFRSPSPHRAALRCGCWVSVDEQPSAERGGVTCSAGRDLSCPRKNSCYYVLSLCSLCWWPLIGLS